MTEVPLFGPGWRADLPDVRDVTPATPEIKQALQKLRRRRAARSALPATVDLREYCLPSTDQAGLQSTSVHAVLGLLGYFERRATGRAFSGSARFLYRTARRLDGIAGDNGVSLRTTFKALARFGCPPERFWPEDAARYDDEPDGTAFGFARETAGLRYVRLDDRGAAGADVLTRIKRYLAAGWACVCGAAVPSGAHERGDLAFPTRFDEPVGGAAFTVVGYDDAYRIRSTKGALIVRGTWGARFGDGGYGRLPYRYVEDRLAVDFWTVWKPEWSASGEFDQPV
jgi:C1A family cysteine protease